MKRTTATKSKPAGPQRLVCPPLSREFSLGFTPDDQQWGVIQTVSRRLLLNCCRQWGKSSVASIVAARRVMACERTLVVVVSPTLRQTKELILKVRERLESWQLPVTGGGLELRLENGSRVLGVPGQEARLRGFSAPSLVIVDEAAKVEDSAYKAIRPMLGAGQGDLLLMSTPFGQRGFFWREWCGLGGSWQRVEAKAVDCARIADSFLDEERKVQGADWFAQEYECSFVAMENQAFRTEWLESARRNGLSFQRLGWRGYEAWARGGHRGTT